MALIIARSPVTKFAMCKTGISFKMRGLVVLVIVAITDGVLVVANNTKAA